MLKIGIAYWSGTGNTEMMAEVLAKSIRAEGLECAVVNISTDNFDISSYDGLLFGCPARGADVLEEDEFEPFFSALEPKLKGRKIALFGSYAWEEGDWMRDWEARVKEIGALLIGSWIQYEAPDEDGIELGQELAKKYVAALRA
ncbi:MAG: flavodoxin domain-containing protein [Bradymonadales bacterium]|jgi:flavodoxin I